MGHVAQVWAGLELEGEDSMVYFSLRHKHVGKQGSSPRGFLGQGKSCPWGPTGMSLLARDRTWQRGCSLTSLTAQAQQSSLPT